MCTAMRELVGILIGLHLIPVAVIVVAFFRPEPGKHRRGWWSW